MAGHWLAELDGSKVTVEVPASSANLGAGYDCLGVALAITDRIELEVRVWSRGEIELTVGEATRLLRAGDAYAFSSRIPHRFRNLGGQACEIVSACTPPSF